MKYTLTVLGMYIFSLVQAQTANLPEWHVGVKADVNFSNISGNGMASGFTAGGQGGLYVERTFNSKWSIQPELLFTQNDSKKGADFRDVYYPDAGNIYAATDIKLAYVSVPVMLKYNVTKSFSFLAGPQYSYLIKDAESLLSSGDGKAFKHSEVSINGGAQFNVGRVSIYGRYNHGLSNINNIDKRYTWYSSHIQLGVAVRLL